MAELNADDIPESEKERIVRQSGILEKLPPDFIPFDPTNATPFTRGGGAGGGVDGARIGAGNRPVEWVDSSDEESEDDYGYDEDGPEPTAESLMREQAAAEFPPLAAEFFDSFLYLVPFSFLYVLMDIMIHQQYAQHPTVLGEIGRLAQTVPTMRYSKTLLVRSMLFALAVICGCSMIYIFNKSPFGDVMRRTPPLGTLWIYTIVQLDLLPACVSLAIVAAFVKYKNLNVIFED